MDIRFIRDDTEEKAISELNEILDVLSAKRHSSEVYTAHRFMLALFSASKKPVEEPPVTPKLPIPSILTPQKAAYTRHASSKKPFGPKRLRKIFGGHVPHPPVQAVKSPVVKPSPVPMPVIPMPLKHEDIPIPMPLKKEGLESKGLSLDYWKSYPLSVLRDGKGVVIVSVSLDKSSDGMVYKITEPSVDSKALLSAKDLIAKHVKKKSALLDDEKFMGKNIAKALKKVNIPYSDDHADKLKYFLKRDLVGFGRVDAFLYDPNIKSVVCDGIGTPVVVSFSNNVKLKTNVVFSTPDELNSFVKYLSSKVGPFVPGSGPNFGGLFNGWRVDGIIGFNNINSKFIITRP